MRSPFRAPRRWVGLLVPAAAGLAAASLLGVAPAAAAAADRVPARLVLASLNTADTQDGLAGVSCPAARACTAVGGTRNDLSGARLAKAWNGTRWTVQSVPGDGLLMGVSCTSARKCTAVGETSLGKPLTDRWNGKAWVNPRHNPGPLDSRLTGVSCTSAARCMAVGHTGGGMLAERWNGTRWALRTVPTPAGFLHVGLSDVSCTSARACTAVGSYITSDGNHESLAATWNGTAWTVRATPLLSDLSLLASVSCTSARACMAVGTTPNGIDETPTPLAERWNGVTWTVVPVTDPAGNGSLNGVSCSSARACTAVGSSTAGALAERWNGTQWAVQSTPDPTGASLNSVSCESAHRCIAAGDVTTSGGQVTLAERWNGTRWAIQPTPGNP